MIAHVRCDCTQEVLALFINEYATIFSGAVTLEQQALAASQSSSMLGGARASVSLVRPSVLLCCLLELACAARSALLLL